MKKAIFLAVFTGYCSALFAVSMNFTGNFRGEGSYFNKPDLGLASGPNKAFVAARALVNPNLVIDDHFSLKSQWLMLSSPGFTSAAQALGNGQGSYIFGDANSMSFFV